jgi:hypothetical protein
MASRPTRAVRIRIWILVSQKRHNDFSASAETIHVNERQFIPMKFSRAAFIVVAIIGTVLAAPHVAGDSQTPGGAVDSDSRFSPSAYTAGWLTADRDDDGSVDYAVRLDERGNKLQEAVDFNRDGRMDDFYFYANDVLQRQELDSNFDEEIDIWIYLWRGVYVQRWERDTDYDGTVDISRDYGQPQ